MCAEDCPYEGPREWDGDGEADADADADAGAIDVCGALTWRCGATPTRVEAVDGPSREEGCDGDGDGDSSDEPIARESVSARDIASNGTPAPAPPPDRGSGGREAVCAVCSLAIDRSKQPCSSVN